MTPETNRRLLLPALVVLHGGILLLAAQGGSYAAVVRPRLAISVTAINAPLTSPTAALEPMLQPVVVLLTPPPIDILGENEARPMTLAASATGGGCTLTAAIEDSLRASSSARDALARMPREARSVANAQMLWDGHWVDAAGVGGPAALAPVRDLVAAAVRAAPRECRDAPVTGPRLLFVAEAAGTRILGFGSGVWSWSQLLES